MAINVTDLRQGAVYQENGVPLQVKKYTHTKMGRGMATIKVKVKNLITGSLVEKTYSSGSKVAEAEVIRQKLQYLYSDAQKSFFMDNASYEQFELPRTYIAEEVWYLTPGTEVSVIMFQGEPLGVELPLKVALRVTYAEPSIKGNTANTALMKVQLETGLEVMTPMFVKTGDLVKVDTRTGEYVERVA